MTVQLEETRPGRWRASVDGKHAEAWVSKLHATHGWVELPEDAGTDQVRDLCHALAGVLGVPVTVKSTPGTARHEVLLAAGATAYQVCPPSTVDCTDADNLAWARSVAVDPAAPVGDLQGWPAERLLEQWVSFYDWIHAGWSPLTDHDHARRTFAPMLDEELDRSRSVVVERAGKPSAVGFVLRAGEETILCCEAVGPDAPHGTEDVLAALAAVVVGLGEQGCTDLLVDGHVSDPHLYPALQQVPHVTGPGLHLLELS